MASGVYEPVQQLYLVLKTCSRMLQMQFSTSISINFENSDSKIVKLYKGLLVCSEST